MKNKVIVLLIMIVLTISFLFSGCTKEANGGPKENVSVNSTEEGAVKESTASAEDAAASEVSVTEKDEVPAADAAAEAETDAAAEAETDAAADDTAAADSEKDTAGTAEAGGSEGESEFSEYLDVDYQPYFKSAEKSGTLEQITYYSEVVGADRTALVYKPCNFPMNARYPVILMIHGLGCEETQWTSMNACALLDHMIEEGTIRPCVAVFPSVVPAGGLTKDSYSAENINAFADFVDEWSEDLWPYLTAHYPLLEEREAHAVCGLSMGGMEALRLGFTYLDFFDYIGSFSAAPSLDTSILTGEGSEYTPDLVLVCTGDKDNTVGDNPYNYYSTIVGNGIDSIWYLHPGEAHSPAVWKLGLYNFVLRLEGSFKPVN